MKIRWIKIKTKSRISNFCVMDSVSLLSKQEFKKINRFDSFTNSNNFYKIIVIKRIVQNN